MPERAESGSHVAFLSSIDGFRNLGAETLARVTPHMQVNEYGNGDTLMARGEPGLDMHIVVEGEVCALDEHRLEISRMGPGDVVGEMALLTGEPRRADVKSVGATRTLSLSREQFYPLLKRDAAFSDFLTAVVKRRLEASGGRGRVGKYRIDASLGAGATASVFRAVHPTLGRPVAIKMLKHARTSDPVFTEKFLTEARTIAELVHPNIVQVYDAEESLGTYFLVMEIVDGVDGEEVLERRGPLPCEQVADIVRQLAAALHFSHSRGVVHRDVKPANFLLANDGTVKLMDFGMAEHLEAIASEEGERRLVVGGTPKYLAPEVALGLGVDGRADIYSLGILAFELLTGRVPFEADRLRTLLQMHVRMPPPDIRLLRPDIPEGLATFVEGALQKDRDARLVDHAQIRRLLVGEAVGTLKTSHRQSWTFEFPGSARNTVEAALRQLASDLEPHGVTMARTPGDPGDG